MRLRIQSGSLGSALGLIGAGVPIVAPDAKWFGVVLIVSGLFAFVFDVKWEGSRLELGERHPLRQRLRMIAPQLIMGVSALGFLAGLYWFVRERSTDPNQGLRGGTPEAAQNRAPGSPGTVNRPAPPPGNSVAPTPARHGARARQPAHAADRSRYTEPLKRFVVEGVTLKSYLQALDGPALESKIGEVWVWSSDVGMWVCENMGEYALSKFSDLSEMQPRNVVAGTPEAKSAVLTVEGLVNNLQAMIERDTWDPHGAPILPKRGCRAVVGGPDDPPAR